MKRVGSAVEIREDSCSRYKTQDRWRNTDAGMDTTVSMDVINYRNTIYYYYDREHGRN